MGAQVPSLQTNTHSDLPDSSSAEALVSPELSFSSSDPRPGQASAIASAQVPSLQTTMHSDGLDLSDSTPADKEFLPLPAPLGAPSGLVPAPQVPLTLPAALGAPSGLVPATQVTDTTIEEKPSQKELPRQGAFEPPTLTSLSRRGTSELLTFTPKAMSTRYDSNRSPRTEGSHFTLGSLTSGLTLTPTSQTNGERNNDALCGVSPRSLPPDEDLDGMSWSWPSDAEDADASDFDVVRPSAMEGSTMTSVTGVAPKYTDAVAVTKEMGAVAASQNFIAKTAATSTVVDDSKIAAGRSKMQIAPHVSETDAGYESSMSWCSSDWTLD